MRKTVLAVLVRFCPAGELQFGLTWPKKAADEEACNYTLVGGGVESGERKLAAMQRELREEVNLGAVDYFMKKIRHPKNMFLKQARDGQLKCYYLFFVRCRQCAELTPGPEVAAVGWFNPHQLRDFAEQGLSRSKRRLLSATIPLLLKQFPEDMRGHERLLREVAGLVVEPQTMAA